MDFSSVIFEFTKYFLAAFYTFVALFYATRMTLKKRAGQNQVVYTGKPLSVPWWNYTLFRFFRVAIWAVCVFRCFLPGIDSAIGYFNGLSFWPILLSGNVLIISSFIFVVKVHMDCKEHWRSGIDPNGPSKLITDGYYEYSRNPMFLGIGIAQVGFFLCLPSVFSFICLVIGWFTLYGQTIAEEKHLEEKFAADYWAYARNVPRW